MYFLHKTAHDKVWNISSCDFWREKLLLSFLNVFFQYHVVHSYWRDISMADMSKTLQLTQKNALVSSYILRSRCRKTCLFGTKRNKCHIMILILSCNRTTCQNNHKIIFFYIMQPLSKEHALRN